MRDKKCHSNGGVVAAYFLSLGLQVISRSRQERLTARVRRGSAGIWRWDPQASNTEGPLASCEPWVCSHLDTIHRVASAVSFL